jgi:tetratricopeptide (TPR) repeat protein
MALDPYAPCPCGSGKRFKWCCQPIHVEIDRALHQDAEGQHEMALKLMAEVVQRHPANPEALGRYAELLYRNNRVEDAENALQKAFEISPNYPFGHLLRGLFRYHEGEIAGALLLFRKAAEAYHPEAVDQLGQVYMLIADCEMKLNRPVAARAAMQIALRHHANDEELRKNYDALFGPQSQLPATARQEHAFRSPAESTAGTLRESWNRVLGAGATKLSDAVRGFEQLTAEDASDAAAWYNLGLARAWLGENAAALEALDRYVELEANETVAAAACTLGEVLRLGQGLEDQADYREHSVTYQLRDPRPLFALLQEWEKDHRLVGAQADQQQGILSALVLEKPQLVTSTPGGGKPLRLGAYLLLIGQVLRFRHSQKEPLDRVCAEVQQRAASGLSEGLERVAHANFSDVVLEALVFPVGVTDRDVGAGQIREHAAAYFEDTWIHRPLRSLNHTPPIDAAGHRTLRKKLLGVIQFLQECATGGIIEN